MIYIVENFWKVLVMDIMIGEEKGWMKDGER